MKDVVVDDVSAKVKQTMLMLLSLAVLDRPKGRDGTDIETFSTN